MGKTLAQILVILLTLASAAAYLILNGKINAGERQIADGQSQIDIGEPALEDGKARLEAGKLKLSDAKVQYKEAEDNQLKVIADNILHGGKGFKEAKQQIGEGDRLVAEGEIQVSDGERRLEAGKIELGLGREQLGLAMKARLAFAIGAVFFFTLMIVLGITWRRSAPGTGVRT